MAIVKISDLPLVDAPVEGTDLFVVVQDNVTKKAYASDIQTYVGFEEVQTATAGQTVFNLTTMTYAAGANNLMVFVDGVNQYEGSSYQETDNNTVTFTQGLHEGALVKFSTVQTQTSSVANAGAVTFLQAGTGAVPRSVQSKLRESVSVTDFGAVGDGAVDDTAAIQAAINAVAEGGTLFIPSGNYYCGGTLTVQNKNINIECSGTIIFSSGVNGYIQFTQTPSLTVPGTQFSSLPTAGDLTLNWSTEPALTYPSDYFFTFISSQVEIIRLGYPANQSYTKNETNAIVDPENWGLRNPVELTYTIAADLNINFYLRRRPVTVRGLKIKVAPAGGPLNKFPVVLINGASNITFDNCEIWRQDSNWYGANIRFQNSWDLTFVNCEVRAQNSTSGDSYAFDNYNSAQITLARCKYVDGNGFPLKQERGYAARHGGYVSFYDCQFAGIDDHYGHNYFIQNCNFTKSNAAVTLAGGSLTIKDCKYSANGVLFAQRADTPYSKGQLTIDNCTTNGQLIYSGRDADVRPIQRRLYDSIRITNCVVNNSTTNGAIQVGGWLAGDTKSPVNAFFINNVYFVREVNNKNCAFIDAYQTSAYRWVSQMFIENCRFSLANYSAGVNKEFYPINGLTATWLKVNNCTGFYFDNIDIDRVDVSNTSNYVPDDKFDQDVVGTTGAVTFNNCDLNGTIDTSACASATYVFSNCNFTNGLQWAAAYPPSTDMAAQTIYLSRNFTALASDITNAPGGSIEYYIDAAVLKD